MLNKNNDYRLIAGVYRKVYLERRNDIYRDSGNLFRIHLWEMMRMLKQDNPWFNPDYFLNYIIWGTEKPKSPSVCSTEA
jgi:hypothetical protein